MHRNVFSIFPFGIYSSSLGIIRAKALTIDKEISSMYTNLYPFRSRVYRSLNLGNQKGISSIDIHEIDRHYFGGSFYKPTLTRILFPRVFPSFCVYR